MNNELTAAEGHAYGSSKTYTHSVGLSCCFRQWRATSHCRFLHGYALKVTIDFGCSKLDENNWCMDFGGLKNIKSWLVETFDHKTLVAVDDPLISAFRELTIAKLMQVTLVTSTGVEAFARIIYDRVEWELNQKTYYPDDQVWVNRVTVAEHEGNSAWYGRAV